MALSLAAFGSGLSLRVTDAQLPQLATQFGITLAGASYVITCFSVAYGISQLFFGPVGDRFGKYLVIAWACIGCAVTALLCAIAPGYAFLLLARLLAGATAAALIPLSMAWIGDVIPYEERQPVLARFLIGQIMGLSTGVFIGGLAADYFSWRVPFFGISAAFVLIGILLLRINRQLPMEARKAHRTSGPALPRMLEEFAQVIFQPWARWVLITVFLEGVFLYGAFAFIATHMHLVHGMPLSTAGSLVMLFGFGGLLFAFCSRWLVKGLGETGLTACGGAVAALALMAIGLAPHWSWAVPGCFCTGLGFYMLHNTLQTNATQMAPERRGAAVAAFASCFFLGQSLGVGAGGVLATMFGTRGVIVTGAFGLILVSSNFGRLLHRRRKKTSAQ